ncbi:MAG: cell division protein ZipA C-terminal FtsZ-binding domain-containing protein [Pseudomonadota bacterium]
MKSWILLIGSLLIVAVIGHGLWTAYRKRNEPIKLDIAEDIPESAVDDLVLLRGELPNGGARPAGTNGGLIEGLRADGYADEGGSYALDEIDGAPPELPRRRAPVVTAPEPAPRQIEEPAARRASLIERAERQLQRQREPVLEFPEVESRPAGQRSSRAEPPRPRIPEELVVLTVLAKSRPFQGCDLLELFLRNGIKFGDMNIFHRVDPATKANQYSVASAEEPGVFDLRAMDSQEFRGLCFFMRLPGPGAPTKIFTDMLTVAEKLAKQLDGEVCDEQRNRLTRQSTEHYRQRVAEFTRRHLSKRA